MPVILLRFSAVRFSVFLYDCSINTFRRQIMRFLFGRRGNPAFYRKLLSLVLPIAFQQFMLAAVSASDALMLGFINQESLSAASLAGQITFVFNLFMGGLTMGTSILVAQYYGKGEMVSIEKIFAYATKVSFLISTVFFWASLFVPEILMRIFT